MAWVVALPSLLYDCGWVEGLWGGGWAAALEVEGQQTLEDSGVVEVGGPAVGGYGGVEVGVGVGQPGGALIVEEETMRSGGVLRWSWYFSS